MQLTPSFIMELEQIELHYWKAYYDASQEVPSYYKMIDEGFAGAIPSVDILPMNRVLGLGQSKPLTKESLEKIIHFYKKYKAKRFMIQLTPSSLDERSIALLKKLGFYHLNNWSKLVYEVPKTPIQVNSNLEIKRVDNSLDELYGQILFMSFDWQDSRLPYWLSATVGQKGYTNYLVYYHNKAIAAGALYTSGVFGSLAFAGTLDAFRGSGAQTLLIQKRISDAQRAGVRYLTAETAQHTTEKPCRSYQNLLKNGFQLAYLRQNWCYVFN